MKKRALLTAVFLTVLIFFCRPADCAQLKPVKKLDLLSGPEGCPWSAIGRVLSKEWSDNGFSVTNLFGGGFANIFAVSGNTDMLGFAALSQLEAVVLGKKSHSGVPAENAVVLAKLYPQYAYFVAREDFIKKHNVRTLGDIFEKRIPARIGVLNYGTSSEFTVRSLFLNGYGFSYGDIKKMGGTVEFASCATGADRLTQDNIDILAFCAGQKAGLVQQLEQRGRIRLLPVDKAALLALRQNSGTGILTIESGAFRSVTAPVQTVGDYVCLTANKALSDDTAYHLCSVLWRKKQTLAEAVPDMNELNPWDAGLTAVPLHEGAKKFWKNLQKEKMSASIQ